MDMITTFKEALKTFPFVTIDGVDGTGKTTTIQEIKQLLRNQGLNPIQFKVPEYETTFAGKLLKKLYNNGVYLNFIFKQLPEVHMGLIYMGYREMNNKKIEVKENTVIFGDRSVIATYAYALSGEQEGFTKAYRTKLFNAMFGRFPTPCAAVLLHAPISVIKDRLNEKGETPDATTLTRLEGVQSMYVEIFNKDAVQYGLCKSVRKLLTNKITIDSSKKNSKSVAADILDFVRREEVIDA